MTASIEILKKLISFKTISRDSNLDLIHWLQELLSEKGIKSWLSFDATSTKANLFASLGPQEPGGLLLSGHTDVVPVEGQNWSSDPFHADIRDGKLFGRGACDMKGFIATIISTIQQVDATKLTKPIHLAFTYDEEVGCKGVRTLLSALKEHNVAPATCIVGEPTNMRVVRSHKGSRNYRCCVKGKAAHASMTHKGVNAIQYACAIVGEINNFADELESIRAPESGYETPYDMLQTSLIQGGLARNIVPSQCEFTFGYRYLPQSDPNRIYERIERFGLQSILPRMLAKCDSSEIVFEKLSDNPPLGTNMNGEFAQQISRHEGVQGIGQHVGFMTEGGIYQQSGIVTVICGPGSIEQAHKPDEYIDLNQLQLCKTFMEDLFKRFEA